jgi:hypothetical protein
VEDDCEIDEMDEVVGIGIGGEDEANDDELVAVWVEDDREMDEMDEMNELGGVLAMGGKDEVDDDDDEPVGDAGGLGASAVELEGVPEEVGLGEDPAARISMLPSSKI